MTVSKLHEKAVLDRLDAIRNPLGWHPVHRTPEGLVLVSAVVDGVTMTITRRGILYATQPRNIESSNR